MTSQYSDATLRGMQRMFGQGFLSPGGAEEIPLIVEGLDLSDCRVLDWGCGLGGPTIALARDCGARDVLGIDIEAGNLEAARANVEAAGLSGRIAFQLVAPGPLPFAEGSFGLVFTKAALCHLPLADKAAVIGEIFRVLAPGGRFAGNDWMTGRDAGLSQAYREWAAALADDGLDFSFASVDWHRRAFEAAGFTEVRLTDRSAETLAESWAAHAEILEADGGALEEEIGAERFATLMRRNAAREEALANGDLKRCHFRARKPA